MESMSHNCYGFVDSVRMIALRPWGFQLRSIPRRIRVLITSAARDDVTPPAMQEFMHAQIRHSSLETWPGKHMMLHLCLDQMLERLIEHSSNSSKSLGQTDRVSASRGGDGIKTARAATSDVA
jgi:hypothetical protein